MAALFKTQVIDRGTTGPHLLITGGIHGDELEPPIAIRRLIEAPELKPLRGRLTLAPIVNEAAFRRCDRSAEDELDLARTCPGRSDGSITERVAYELAQHIREADYYIDLHTGGAKLSVWPLTGYMLHANADVLGKQRGIARAFNLPVIWGTDPALDGRSLSVARDEGVPAIYAEYEGGGRCSMAAIDAYVDGCLNVMTHLGMIERRLPQSRVRYVVEDSRPGSGHMQRCYPAPVGGCFMPTVELGQAIEIGQPLGAIVDPHSGIHHNIIAAQTGRVLVLRTWATVQAGDSLAVILETAE